MLRRLLRMLGIYRIYEKWLNSQIILKEKPQHIAVVLDGNRRWAMRKALPPFAGHKEGAEIVGDFLEWCLNLDIKIVTVYAFSTENFYRSESEVKTVFEIIEENVKKLYSDDRIHRNHVRVKAIGRLDVLPETLRRALREVEEETQDYGDYFLNIAVAYGGRAEIVDAAREMAEDVLTKKLRPDQIDESIFNEYLYTAHLPNPYPDLIIRTSGEERLSGFLLWQSAYSELLFLDVYWPDFRKIDLLRAIRTYQQRKRRFGS